MVPGSGIDREDFVGFGLGHGGGGGSVDEPFDGGAFLGCGQGVDGAGDGGGNDFVGVSDVEGDDGGDVSYAGDTFIEYRVSEWFGEH